MTTEHREHWERLSELVSRNDQRAIRQLIESLPATELSRVVNRLSQAERTTVLQLVEPGQAAAIVEQIPESQAIEIFENLAPTEAAAILEELPSDEQADLIAEIEPEEARAILAEMEPEEARNVAELVRYPKDVAGGLMVKEYVSYTSDTTVAEVIDDLRRNRARYEGYNVLYVYVTDGEGRLGGVLRLRNLVISDPDARLDSMAAEPTSVPTTTPLDELGALFDRHLYLGLPVVDDRGRLVGVAHRSAVEEALAERSESLYRSSLGIVRGEETRSMPAFVRSGRRLSWLTTNIALNVLAASVIALFQETLAAVIALAVFLPIISDMSGCSGNQAVAVSVREMSLGLISPRDLFRVWRQEILVGLLNGTVLGVLIALVAWLWQGNVYLGLVVGLALALNTLVAVSLGGLLPLVVKRMGRDPAIASGPILTTVTDMCGFLLVLGLATILLPYLVA